MVKLLLILGILAASLALISSVGAAPRPNVVEDPGGGGGGQLYRPCDGGHLYNTVYMVAYRFGGVSQGQGAHIWNCQNIGVGDHYFAWDYVHSSYFLDEGWSPFFPCWWVPGCWHDGNTGNDYQTSNYVFAWKFIS